MQQRKAPTAVRPSAEPEIIPPGAASPTNSQMWVSSGEHDTRIYVTRLGPIGKATVLLAIGVFSAAAFILLLGAALIGVLSVGVLVIGAIVASIVRGHARRRR